MIDPAIVLIVDDDFGFVTWLGVTLANGNATLPATSASKGQRLLEALRVSPDLAVVNLQMTGAIELIANSDFSKLAMISPFSSLKNRQRLPSSSEPTVAA